VLALRQVVQHFLLVFSIVFGEIGGIARLAVNGHQPFVPFAAIETRVDLIQLLGTRRDRAGLGEAQFTSALKVGVLAEERPVGPQMGAHIREEHVERRQRTILCGDR
jgi:hypothetical protein